MISTNYNIKELDIDERNFLEVFPEWRNIFLNFEKSERLIENLY